MPKKTIKVTALIVCFALLVLSVPTLNAKPKNGRFDIDRFIKKQVAFVASLLSFLPFNDGGTDKAPNEQDGIKSKIKITADLESGRPSDRD
jgi:hypothetical protein